MPLYEDEEPTGDFAHILFTTLSGLAFRFGAPELKFEDNLAKAVDATPVAYRDRLLEQYQKGKDKCESPIETIMLPWLLTQAYPWFKYNPTLLLPGETNKYERMTLAVIPQLPIGKYRADFALAGSRGGLIRFLIVECDGKEFHDGVNNVIKDVERDVRLLKNKRVLDIVRLDGSAILRNPSACARSVASSLASAWTKGNKETAWKFEP